MTNKIPLNKTLPCKPTRADFTSASTDTDFIASLLDDTTFAAAVNDFTKSSDQFTFDPYSSSEWVAPRSLHKFK